MYKVYQRVSLWNSLRYDRIFSSRLALSLLHEEYKEWLVAKTDADKLDALCDIVYVAMGVVWKLDVEDEDFDAAMANATKVVHNMVNMNELHPAFLISTHLAVFEYDNNYPAVDSMAMIIMAACTQITALGLTTEQVIEVMNIVCDSNDSKEVRRVEPNVKANGISKGKDFVAPEPRLQLVLDKARNLQ